MERRRRRDAFAGTGGTRDLQRFRSGCGDCLPGRFGTGGSACGAGDPAGVGSADRGGRIEMSLMAELNAKALELGIPLSAHVDVTYRCNERCVHCYLPHDDRGELSTAEVKDLFGQLAEAGVFFLTISGGEPFLRTDLFELLAHARALTFNVKLKTNGILIG